MLTERELSDKATELCKEQAKKSLRGELLIETKSSELEWDKIQLRNIFEQFMTIWKKYGGFDVIIDSNGNIVGFIDHDKYVQSNDGDLTPDDINAIVADIDLVPDDARLVNTKIAEITPGTRIYKVIYELHPPSSWYTHLDVEINPTRRAVIAVRPVTIEGNKYG